MSTEEAAPKPEEAAPEEVAPEEVAPEEVDLKPKPPPPLAPRGIRTFTVCRKRDETGISGTGVVIEGAIFATGQCIAHWLYPPPRGGIAIFNVATKRCLDICLQSEYNV